MAGNSQRPGARRKQGSKKGAVVGSGGQRRRGLRGKGPTPAAQDREGHPAARRSRRPGSDPAPARRDLVDPGADLVIGRNPVVEALRAGVPARTLTVQRHLSYDDRVREALAAAERGGLAIREADKADLDAMANGQVHQGLALTVDPFEYCSLAELRAVPSPLLVMLDGVTDPHNLGAIARSSAAFGAAGLILPRRRSARVTAAAWRTSAGALASMPVCQVGNLAQTLRTLAGDGCFSVGLDAGGDESLEALDRDFVSGGLVVVVGGEGKGLGRLVAERVDKVVSIDMAGGTESLNASVAAGIALHWIAHLRA